MTLLEKVPAYAASFQLGIQKRAIAKDNRIVDSLTATAEERYIIFSSNILHCPACPSAYVGLLPWHYSRNIEPHPQKSFAEKNNFLFTS
jgi:hypothetical protein